MLCEIHNTIWRFLAKYYFNDNGEYHGDNDIGVLLIMIDVFYIILVSITFWFVIPIMWLNKKIRFKCKT